jgi:hypothetical protein
MRQGTARPREFRDTERQKPSGLGWAFAVPSRGADTVLQQLFASRASAEMHCLLCNLVNIVPSLGAYDD